MHGTIVAVTCLMLSLFVAQHATIRVHCSHMERIHEDHIHYCCKHPDGHDEVTEKCALETKFKLPSSTEEALEDVTVDQVMLGSCWGKCVFEHYNFVRNGSLDMNAVRAHYKLAHNTDPEYEKEMVQAFEKCHGKAEQATMELLSMPLISAYSGSNSCNPMPSIIMSCVIYNFFHNCPASRWSNSTECVETLAFAKKCKDVLTTM